MSYCSDVLIRIKPRDGMEDVFEKLLAKAALEYAPWFKAIKDFNYFDQFMFDKAGILISCESVKWYEDYEIVQACGNMFSYFEDVCEDEDHQIDGCYLVLGEDTDDNRENYFNDGYDLGYIRRQIFWED